MYMKFHHRIPGVRDHFINDFLIGSFPFSHGNQLYDGLQPVEFIAVRRIFRHPRKALHIQLIVIFPVYLKPVTTRLIIIFSHLSPLLPSRASPVIQLCSISSPGTCSRSFSAVSSVISVKYRPFRSPSKSPYLKEA